MPNEFIPSAPSTDPEISQVQLNESLKDLLKPEGASNPKAYRAFLLQIIGHAWGAVANGEPKEVGEDCKRIEGVRRILADHIPADLDPRAEAAIEILGAIRFLQAAIRVLENRELRRRPLQRSEQRVLRSLQEAKTYLQRRDVHRELEKRRVNLSPPRVGQILLDLFHDGYLLRYQAPAQGGLTAFYALAPLGKEVLRNQETASNVNQTDQVDQADQKDSRRYSRLSQPVAEPTPMFAPARI
jgi:hypothetical protein